MKHLFAAIFAVLLFFSAVAHLTRPRIEHVRLDQIRFYLAPAGEDGAVSADSFHALFADLDTNNDQRLDADDIFPNIQGASDDQDNHRGRLRGMLVLEAAAPHLVSEAPWPEVLSTMRDRLTNNLPANHPEPFYFESDPVKAADTDRLKRQLIAVYEMDLDDDFAVTKNDAADYFARLDSDRDGDLDETDLPIRPHKLVWASDAGPMRQAQIKPFNRRYPQHRLVLDPQANAEDKTIVQCIAGVGPDVFDSTTPFTLAGFVRSGVAMDITDEMHRRGIYEDAIWEAVRPFYMMDGRMYGHPRNAGAPAVWFNKDLFDAAGEPYPDGDWTWEEFVEIAQRFTVRDEKGRPVQFGLINIWDQSTYFPLIFLRQWGGTIFNEAGTRCTLDSPEAIAAIQFVHDLMYKYNIMPSPADESAMAGGGGWGMGGVPIALMGDAKGAMGIGYRWWLSMLRQPEFEGLRLGAAPMPKGPSGEVAGAGGAVLVNAQCRNLAGALLFMEYLHSEAYNDVVNEQADAVGPVKTYHYGKYEADFLHNPDYPEEDYNAVWRDALANAQPPRTSPYANGQLVDRTIKKYFDLIKYRGTQQSVAELMKHATQEVNQLIIASLKQDPTLKEAYYAELDQGAQPAWDNPEDAP